MCVVAMIKCMNGSCSVITHVFMYMLLYSVHYMLLHWVSHVVIVIFNCHAYLYNVIHDLIGHTLKWRYCYIPQVFYAVLGCNFKTSAWKDKWSCLCCFRLCSCSFYWRQLEEFLRESSQLIKAPAANGEKRSTVRPASLSFSSAGVRRLLTGNYSSTPASTRGTHTSASITTLEAGHRGSSTRLRTISKVREAMCTRREDNF